MPGEPHKAAVRAANAWEAGELSLVDYITREYQPIVQAAHRAERYAAQNGWDWGTLQERKLLAVLRAALKVTV